MKRRSWCVAILLWGCAGAGPSPAPPAATPGHAAGGAPAAPPTPPASGASSSGASAFRPCGDLGCKAFASATQAFDFVLAEAPRVLAVGEAHAQGDGPKSASATRRFMDTLLPRLSPRATDLVIELWLANGSCGKVEQKVERQQSAVTAPQAASNQNEFVELGHRAKALGIMPHALVPSCEQYQKIAGAGAADIEEMLVMIKSVTAHDVTQLIAQRAPDRLIVAYGGAMHNDLAPRAGREEFSFGPELARATEDRYVELDLVIPEQIKETEAWRALPWYSGYSAAKAGAGGEAYLFSWATHAYALVFPAGVTAEAAP